jgi:hypothetical protein
MRDLRAHSAQVCVCNSRLYVCTRLAVYLHTDLLTIADSVIMCTCCSYCTGDNHQQAKKYDDADDDDSDGSNLSDDSDDDNSVSYYS